MWNPRHQRSPKNLTIDDVYGDWVSDGGIFADFVDMPWSVSVDAQNIGVLYGAESAERFIAPIVYKFLSEEGILDSTSRTKLAAVVRTRFIQKWAHLWDLYSIEYNPLDTYNLVETGEKSGETTDDETLTHGHTITGSGTDSETTQHGHTISNSGTDTETLTHGHIIAHSGSDETETDYGKVTTDAGEPIAVTTNQREGFNSSDFQNVTKQTVNNVTDNTETQSGSDTATTTYGGTETNSGDDVTRMAHGLTETHGGSDTETTSYGKVETHGGNDVTDKDGTYREEFSNTKSGLMYRAPAELLTIDREFWLQDYFSIVFEDINSFLTLAVYAEKKINNKVF